MSRRVLPVVLALLDLGKRRPVVSVCTGSSRLIAARLGDKCSDKPRLRHWPARGVRPVLGTTVLMAKPPQAARQLPHGCDLILIRTVRVLCSSWPRGDGQLMGGMDMTVVVRWVPCVSVRCGTRVARLARTTVDLARQQRFQLAP
jgi:hypothetical protein